MNETSIEIFNFYMNLPLAEVRFLYNELFKEYDARRTELKAMEDKMHIIADVMTKKGR